MSPKRIQLFFMLGVCAITLHFTIRLGGDICDYFSLQNRAQAQVHQWETVPIKNQFALKANYSFIAQEKTWRGEYTFSPPYYLNEGAALSALKLKAKESWSAWYQHKSPQFSALEKKFPTNILVRTLICYGVIFYFFCLYKRLVVV